MGTSNGPNTFLAGTAAGHGAPSGITGSLVSLAPARCSASPLASQTEVDHLTLRAIAPGCSHANVEKSSHHHSRTSSISSIAAIAPICAALLRDCRNSSITVAPRQSRRLPYRLPRQSQSHFVNLVDCRVIQFHPTSAPRACSASSAWTTRTRASSCPCRPSSSSSSSRPPPLRRRGRGRGERERVHLGRNEL